MGWCNATFQDAGCIADLMRHNNVIECINCDAIEIGDSGATNIADALLVSQMIALMMSDAKIVIISSKIYKMQQGQHVYTHSSPGP